MIILCPKAFAGKNLTSERDFLRYYLSKVGQKAIVANEVWDAFRFRYIEHASTPEVANNIIANMRGTFVPETLRLKDNFEEIDPKDYDEHTMMVKTKNLIERRWAEIDFFITQESDNYLSLTHKPKIIKLQEFLVECINDISKRDIVESYYRDEVYHKLG